MRRFTILVLLSLLLSPVRAEVAEMGEDGLHKPDWFSLTFKDISEDIADAAAEDKRLVVVFEQKGCIYCRKLHEEILSDPDVSGYIKANFNVVQMNMFGDEEVTDLDGEVLSEKEAVRKWDVMYTPLFLFMPEQAPESGQHAGQVAVARLPGAFGRMTLLNMFRWVKEKGYNGDEHFQKYHARLLAERAAAGNTGE